jgi:transcriptional regulator with XRE-family HTH domain
MTLAEMVALATKSLRKRRGLTQAELAAMMGTTDRTISQIETGGQIPTLDTIEQLLTALDLSPREFFDFDLKGKAEVRRVQRLAELGDAARRLSEDGLTLAAKMIDLMEKHEADLKPAKRSRG